MTQPALPSIQPSAAWYPDPAGRYTHRYWDGEAWTEHVSTDGQQHVDPAGTAQNVTPQSAQGSSPAAIGTPPAPQQPAPDLLGEFDIPRFGARAKAKELVEELKATRGQRDELQAERHRLADLGVLDVAELEDRKERLTSEVEGLEAELARRRTQVEGELEARRTAAKTALDQELAGRVAERISLSGRLTELKRDVVETQELSILQEVGVYEYRHPLTDAVAYQAELKRIQDQTKAMARKDGGAVLANDDWHVNGSMAQGRTMIRDYRSSSCARTTPRPTTSSAA